MNKNNLDGCLIKTFEEKKWYDGNIYENWREFICNKSWKCKKRTSLLKDIFKNLIDKFIAITRNGKSNQSEVEDVIKEAENKIFS
ncbi:MAG: hypothetical protein LBR43_02190 [Spiroplasmataceae bacterium]|nr:hypothetical protein [Spiroplasmataceae bacterium]